MITTLFTPCPLFLPFSPSLPLSREEGDAALQALREALGRYDLPFAVLLSDPDMAAFRAMPQFRQLQEEVSGVGETRSDRGRWVYPGPWQGLLAVPATAGGGEKSRGEEE